MISGQKISKAGKSILQGLLKNQKFQRADFINLGYGLLCGKLVNLPSSAAKPKFIEVLLISRKIFEICNQRKRKLLFFENIYVYFKKKLYEYFNFTSFFLNFF